MMVRKTIYLPDKINELWPLIKSQAALAGIGPGEWLIQAVELKLKESEVEIK